MVYRDLCVFSKKNQKVRRFLAPPGARNRRDVIKNHGHSIMKNNGRRDDYNIIMLPDGHVVLSDVQSAFVQSAMRTSDAVQVPKLNYM